MSTDKNTGSFPDWTLIDEISIPLLESGVGTLPFLQAALPSILAMNSQEEKVEERFRKIIRIAQLQIQHLLRSQQELLKHLEKIQNEVKSKKGDGTVRNGERKLSLQQDYTKFKCEDCGKIFLNENFLTSHFERRHPIRKNARHSSTE